MTALVSFKAVVHDGKIQPVDARLDLPEDEPVWVTVSALPAFELKPFRADDPGLLAARKALSGLPRLEIDKELQIERERS